MSKAVELARHLETLHINNMYKNDFYWTWDKTDEELEDERKRLLALLIDEEKQKKGEHVCVETKKKAAKPRKRVVRKTVKKE